MEIKTLYKIFIYQEQLFSGDSRRLTAGDRLFDTLQRFLLHRKLNFCGWTAGRAHSFFSSTMANGLNELLAVAAVQILKIQLKVNRLISIDYMDVKYCFNHDLTRDLFVGDVDSAKQKEKSVSSNLKSNFMFP